MTISCDIPLINLLNRLDMYTNFNALKELLSKVKLIGYVCDVIIGAVNSVGGGI